MRHYFYDKTAAVLIVIDPDRAETAQMEVLQPLDPQRAPQVG